MKKMLKTRIIIAITSLAIFGLFTQCNQMEEYAADSKLEFGTQGVSGGSISASGKAKIKNAFQNTVWTTLRTSDGNFSCTGCHSKGGLGGRIPHSDSDVDVAMNAMDDYQLVDKNNPVNSRIVTAIRSGHNGTGGAAAAATLSNMVGQWVEVVEEVEAEELGDGGGDEPPPPVVRCDPETVTEEFVFGELPPGTGLTRRGSFDQYVFPVMQMTGCANCHTSDGGGGRIAHSSNNAGTAYNVWDNNNLADFNNPTNSDILTKFANGHQGFNSASDEYNDIRNAIIAWRDNIDPNAGSVGGNATIEERIYDVCEVYSEPIQSMNSLADDEDGDLQVSGGSFDPSMATVTGDFAYTNNEYIGNPNAHGLFNVNNNNGGRIVFEFDVYEPGTYEVVAEVWSTDGSTDSFYVAIGDTPTPTEALGGMDYVAWRFGDTNEQFQAMEVQDSDAGTKKTWNLAVGKHYLVFKERENFSRLRNVVVKQEGANDPVTVNAYKVLEYDLSAALNTPGAKLTYRVEDHDEKSYKISDLRIVGAQYAYVKNLKILINDNFYSGNGTYTLVDEKITSDNYSLSSSAMILLKERGAGDWPEIDPDKMTEYLAALADPNVTDYSSFWLIQNGEIVYQPTDVLSIQFQTLVMTQPKI